MTFSWYFCVHEQMLRYFNLLTPVPNAIYILLVHSQYGMTTDNNVCTLFIFVIRLKFQGLVGIQVFLQLL